MPSFIKKDKEAGPEAPAGYAPAAPAGEQPGVQPQADQPQVPPGQEAQPLQPPQGAPAPPPLPRGQEAGRPGQLAPPPLDPKRAGTYVMTGSGEGRTDSDAPWAAATETVEPPSPTSPAQPMQPVAPQPDAAAGKIQFQLPAVAPEGGLPAAEPAAEPALKVPRPKHTGLWVVLAIFLVAAGGFAAWYFIKQSRLLEADTSDDEVKPAGVVPAAGVSPDAGPADAGGEAAADVAPEQAPGVDAGEEASKQDEEKKEKEKEKGEAAKRKKRKKKRKRREVAKREGPKRSSELALDYYKKGNGLIRKKRFREAVALFKKALRANPKLAIAHRGLGICYAQMRDNKRACREYRIYLQMIPKDSKEVPTLKQILKSCK